MGTARTFFDHCNCRLGTARTFVDHCNCRLGTVRTFVGHCNCRLGTARLESLLFSLIVVDFDGFALDCGWCLGLEAWSLARFDSSFLGQSYQEGPFKPVPKNISLAATPKKVGVGRCNANAVATPTALCTSMLATLPTSNVGCPALTTLRMGFFQFFSVSAFLLAAPGIEPGKAQGTSRRPQPLFGDNICQK